MCIPRMTIVRRLVAAGVLIGLTLPSVSLAAGPPNGKLSHFVCPPGNEDLDDEDRPPKVHPVVLEAVKGVQLMLATMALAPSRHQRPNVQPATATPPMDQPVPLVLKTPTPPVDVAGPPGDGNPTPASTPEPASLATGLVGASLALATWLRQRRRGKSGNLPTTEQNSEKDGELLTQPV